jgi:hypothetical protein
MSQAQYQAIQDWVAARDEDDGDRAARLLQVKASAVRSYKAMDGLFWNQFHLQRERRDAKRG